MHWHLHIWSFNWIFIKYPHDEYSLSQGSQPLQLVAHNDRLKTFQGPPFQIW